MPLTIRPAEPSDAQALSALNARTWRTAYDGVLPQPALDHGVLSPRAWRNVVSRITGPDALERDSAVFVAADGSGRSDASSGLWGFGWGGAARLADAPWAGEIYMLYVHADVQRRGVGRQVFNALARHLISRGFFEVGVWCVAANIAGRAFYSRMHGMVVKQRTASVGGAQVPVVGFAWPDAGLLQDWTAEGSGR